VLITFLKLLEVGLWLSSSFILFTIQEENGSSEVNAAGPGHVMDGNPVALQQ
jgi:hypothetical protein